MRSLLHSGGLVFHSSNLGSRGFSLTVAKEDASSTRTQEFRDQRLLPLALTSGLQFGSSGHGRMARASRAMTPQCRSHPQFARSASSYWIAGQLEICSLVRMRKDDKVQKPRAASS